MSGSVGPSRSKSCLFLLPLLVIQRKHRDVLDQRCYKEKPIHYIMRISIYDHPPRGLSLLNHVLQQQYQSQTFRTSFISPFLITTRVELMHIAWALLLQSWIIFLVERQSTLNSFQHPNPCDILASQLDLMNSRPEVAIGAFHQDGQSFPQDRSVDYIPVPFFSFSIGLISSLGLVYFFPLTDGN